MEKFARIAFILIGLAMLVGALGFGLAPTLMERDFGVIATRIDGLGTLRADLGGTFLGLALCIALGLRPGQAHWLRIPVLFMGSFLLFRIVHLAIDGVSVFGMRSLIVEVFLIAIMAWAQRRLEKAGAA